MSCYKLIIQKSLEGSQSPVWPQGPMNHNCLIFLNVFLNFEIIITPSCHFSSQSNGTNHRLWLTSYSCSTSSSNPFWLTSYSCSTSSSNPFKWKLSSLISSFMFCKIEGTTTKKSQSVIDFWACTLESWKSIWNNSQDSIFKVLP